MEVAKITAEWIFCLARIYCHAHACSYNWELCAVYSTTPLDLGTRHIPSLCKGIFSCQM